MRRIPPVPEWASIETEGYGAKPRRRTPGAPGRPGRPANSREYAIAWGVKNRPYTKERLIEMCKREDAPSYWFIRTEWNGFWDFYTTLVEAGMPPRPKMARGGAAALESRANRNAYREVFARDEYNLVQLVANCGVSTKDGYEKYRKEHPELCGILPPREAILRSFGSWTRFAYEIGKFNAEMSLRRYVEESEAAGRWLTVSECDGMGIAIRPVMEKLEPLLFNTLCYRKLEEMRRVRGTPGQEPPTRGSVKSSNSEERPDEGRERDKEEP